MNSNASVVHLSADPTVFCKPLPVCQMCKYVHLLSPVPPLLCSLFFGVSLSHAARRLERIADGAELTSRTKFPIKSLPNLKTLAADLTPIPVPQTIPPPAKSKKEREREREKKENGVRDADRGREEIVID